jgi:hypothetical protein
MSFSELQKQDVIRLCVQRKRRRLYALYKAKQQQVQQQLASINTQFDFNDVDENITLDDLDQLD